MTKNTLLLNLLFFTVLLFSFPHKVNAFLFQKYINNPIVSPSKPYDTGSAFSSSTVFFNNQFYMYYSGSDGQKDTINLATSLDGLNWTKNNANPLISPNLNNPFLCEKGAHDPDVIYDSEELKFKMWYVVNCEPKSTGVPRYWIKYAESIDGINWAVNDNPVLSPSNPWEIEGLTWPTVLKENNQYKMWYSGRNSVGLWQIGYAISNNGINWQKNAQPVISPNQSWESSGIGGPDILFDNNEYNLFYHSNIIYAKSSDGITWIKPNNNPLILTVPGESIIWSPDIIKKDNNLILYYSVLVNNKWFISVASEQPLSSALSPTKLILLPGFFGSWNKEAILHNQQTDPSDWKLNPIVKEYDGIINSLKNIGYEENTDFYVFGYDWRQPLNNSADDLNSFITQHIPDQNTKVDLLGHSEGGQVARVYSQKYGTDKVDKLLTVGSPFKGSAISYQGVEGGEMDHDSPLDLMGKKVLLQINKKEFLETDRKSLNNSLPILKDLLPTYDYLTNNNDQPISVSSMSIKNDTLISYEPTLSNIFPKLITFYGDKGDTLFGHKVGPRTIFDQLYDLYPDGHPIANNFEIGDLTILATSAASGTDTNILVEKDHGEIVTDSIAIKQMFNKLGISYQNDQIVEGHNTAVFPSLLFLIQSPAVMQVTYDGITVDEKDGMIFIENAPSTTYTLKVIGTGLGNYTVNIGEFVNRDVIWNKIEGTVTNPQNQTDNYAIAFNNQNPHPFIVNQNDPLSLFDALITKLTDINKTASNKSIKASINSLQNAKKYFINENKTKLFNELQNTHTHLFQAIKEVDLSAKSKLLEATSLFENLYDVSLKPFMNNVPTGPFSSIVLELRKLVDKNYERLLLLKIKGQDINVPMMYLSAIEQKINATNGAIANNNSRLATILIQSIGQLLLFVNNFK